MFYENANSEDPDQTPHYAASDLALHCLPMSHKKDARPALYRSGIHKLSGPQ